MNKFFVKDIKDMKSFEKYGDTFTQIRSNPETGWWLYRRVNNESGNVHFEVVKGEKVINPDGSVVRAYPGSNDWGRFGYTVMNTKHAEKIINFLMEAKSRTSQEIFEFKKTL